jgi:transposase, IS5 family
MSKPVKKRASAPVYVSAAQLSLEGFESPFSTNLDPKNRWVVLAKKIPWDELSNIYLKQIKPKKTGRPGISPRVVIGSLIIKHLCNLDDRETVAQITENIYMQYFLGYSSFTTIPPFDPSLFVEFRSRLGPEQIDAINKRILSLSQEKQSIKTEDKKEDKGDAGKKSEPANVLPEDGLITHKGRVLLDATACPQDIAYPTDLNLLSDAREKAEELIDRLFIKEIHGKKPRTYRNKARKLYLNVAQKKIKQKKVVRKAVGQQLRFLKRNLGIVNKLLDTYKIFPLKPKEQKYLMVLHTLYQQQNHMFANKVHSVEDRIVSIHQPHVRPIVRGKAHAQVEFGSKIHVSLVDGYSFLDTLSWDAFNEGSRLLEYIENYRKRFGYYPKEVLADKIYCSRENRRKLQELDIKLLAKPLGRPSAVKKEHVRPGERNPIEGKFGQGKNAYGLGRIKARLKNTSESWIASIILVLNLVKLAGEALLCLLRSFSARKTLFTLMEYAKKIAVAGISSRQPQLLSF